MGVQFINGFILHPVYITAEVLERQLYIVYNSALFIYLGHEYE